MNDRRPRPTINNVKPPLGVIPIYIWDSKRKEELAAAIDRYLNAGERIPEEWVEEYNEIVENSTEEVVVNE
jgi:phage gp29-like protein